MEQNKKTKIDPLRRKYYYINLIIGLILFLACLCALPWGTQYIYGAMFGFCGQFVYLFVLSHHSNIKRLSKKNKIKSFVFSSFIFRLAIIAFFLLIPMLLINGFYFSQQGVELILYPVNVVVPFIYFNVPWISSILLVFQK